MYHEGHQKAIITMTELVRQIFSYIIIQQQQQKQTKNKQNKKNLTTTTTMPQSHTTGKPISLWEVEIRTHTKQDTNIYAILHLTK